MSWPAFGWQRVPGKCAGKLALCLEERERKRKRESKYHLHKRAGLAVTVGREKEETVCRRW